MIPVIVTEHARQRLLERFGCKDKKTQKVADKAWRSVEPLPPMGRWQNKGEKNLMQGKMMRFFMGTIFVFASYQDKAVLITILTVGKQKTVLA